MTPDFSGPAHPTPSSFAATPEAGIFGQALFAQSPLSTVVYDTAGRITAANAAFERLFALHVDDIRDSYSILEDAQLAELGLMPTIRRAFAGEAVVLPPLRYDSSLVSDAGSTTWTQAHFYPVRDADGVVAAVVLVHIDLTARFVAEEALRASEQRSRVALEAGRMGDWEWAIGENRVTLSPALERMHGLTPGSFGGTPEDYQRDIHPDDRERVASTIAATMAGGDHHITYRIVRPDGEVRWLDARGLLVRDADGRPARLVGVCADVTDRRRAEDGMRLLAEAGAALAGSLDQDVTLDTVARLVVPEIGDFCAVDLVDAAAPGGVRRPVALHADPGRAAEMEALRGYPPSLDAPAVVADVLRTGVPRLIPVVEVSAFSTASQGQAAHQRLLEKLAPQSVIVVPLVARGATVGALSVATSGSRRRFTGTDLTLVLELGRRAALAMDNARLHAESLAARDRAGRQAVELDAQAERLREQAAELEAQRHELEEQIEEAHVLAEELQQTNEALQRATERAERESVVANEAARDVSAILESIGDPFVVHDADWRFRYINAPAADLFARSGHGPAESMLGRELWDAYPDIVGTAMEQEMRRAAAARAPVVCEVFYPPTGVWSELHCYPMPDGGLATSWTDVTQRKSSEESQHFLAEATAILASSLDYEVTLRALAQLVVPTLADWCSVHVVDGRGVPQQLAVAHVDPARVEWAHEVQRRFPPDPNAPTGVPNVVRTGRPELIPRITDDMLEAGISDPEYRRLLRAVGLRSAMTVPLVARGRVLGAMSLVAAESGRVYGDADLALAGELARRAALAVDNARLHREALHAREAAEAANRAKADFLAVMSHELRTPLNAIGGYTQLLEMGVRGPITEQQRADLERIQRSQRHLLGLINDVLNYAKLEAARVDFTIREIAVEPLLAGLQDLVAPQLAAKRLSYECCATDEATKLRGDEEKVRQVLLNLLSNAVKFTPAGGRVAVSSESDGHVVHLRVSDTGVGIPGEQLDAIFEPFVQLSRGLSSGHEGTGLGLAISRDLARGMGGDLVATSEVGAGSTFTLTLPRA